jgi:hypothetical protein
MWASIEEEYPKEEGQYICWVAKDDKYNCKKPHYETLRYEYDVCDDGSKEHFFVNSSNIISECVTHWLKDLEGPNGEKA